MTSLDPADRKAARARPSGLDVSSLTLILGSILLAVLIGDGLILSAVSASTAFASAPGAASGGPSTAPQSVDGRPSPSPSAQADVRVAATPETSHAPLADPRADDVSRVDGLVRAWAVPAAWRLGGTVCHRSRHSTVTTWIFEPPWWNGTAVTENADPAGATVLVYAKSGADGTVAVEWAGGQITVSRGPVAAIAAASGMADAAAARVAGILRGQRSPCSGEDQ